MEELDSEVGFVTLVRGNIEGKPFWAYLSVFPSKHSEFTKINDSGQSYVMTDYGDVLKFALDEESPSEKIQKEMQETYGIDPNFMDISKDL